MWSVVCQHCSESRLFQDHTQRNYFVIIIIIVFVNIIIISTIIKIENDMFCNIWKHFQDHVDACELTIRTCEYQNCDTIVPRKEYLQHLQTCPNQPSYFICTDCENFFKTYQIKVWNYFNFEKSFLYVMLSHLNKHLFHINKHIFHLNKHLFHLLVCVRHCTLLWKV